MIAVSSHRPHAQSGVYRANQIAANRSWQQSFSRIIYLGPNEPELDGPTISFVPSEPFPRIRDLAALCGAQPDWCAVVNADIIIGPNFPRVENELRTRNAHAAVSRRYQFTPGSPPETGVFEDLGLDFFAATPRMWAFVSREIPDQFRLGHCLWDTWALAFFSHWGGRLCYDVTPQRFVFHPRHEDRIQIHPINTAPDATLNRLTWPRGRLRCCIDTSKGVCHDAVKHLGRL